MSPQMDSNWNNAISAYKTAAEKFVHVVDSAEQQSPALFLAEIEVSLPELHIAALGIPAVAPSTSEIDNLTPTYTRAVLYDALRRKLERMDAYWTIFDATSSEPPVQGSLADDIGDIYFDVKEDLHYLEREGPNDDVLWDLRFGFLSHWGRHLTSALKAIYDLKLR